MCKLSGPFRAANPIMAGHQKRAYQNQDGHGSQTECKKDSPPISSSTLLSSHIQLLSNIDEPQSSQVDRESFQLRSAAYSSHQHLLVSHQTPLLKRQPWQYTNPTRQEIGGEINVGKRKVRMKFYDNNHADCQTSCSREVPPSAFNPPKATNKGEPFEALGYLVCDPVTGTATA